MQDLGYEGTFPLLLNIAGEPTYFIPLKDNTNLVKSYAMVNVAQYQIVATGGTVSQCEQEYIKLLSESGVTTTEELPQTEASGVIAEIRSAVLDGNTYYFFRLEGEDVFYSVSAAQSPAAVILDAGDSVTIEHDVPDAESASDILSGGTITSYQRAEESAPTEVEPAPPVTGQETEPADTQTDTETVPEAAA